MKSYPLILSSCLSAIALAAEAGRRTQAQEPQRADVAAGQLEAKRRPRHEVRLLRSLME